MPGAEGIRRRLLEDAATFYDNSAKLGNGVLERFQLANSAYNVGRLRRLLGDDAKALEALRKARTRYRDLVKVQPEYAGAWSMIGNCDLESMLILWGEGRLDESEAEGRDGAEALARALEIVDAGLKDDVLAGQASTFNNLGLVLIDLGRLDEARQAYRKTTEIRKGLVSRTPSSPRFNNNLGSSFHNVAVLELKVGRLTAAARQLLSEAGEFYDRAVALSPGESRLAEYAFSNRSYVGDVLRRLGDLEEADRASKDSVQKLQALVAGSPDVPSFQASLAWALVRRSWIYSRLARDAEAAAASLGAIELSDRVLARQPARADYREGLAAALVERGAGGFVGWGKSTRGRRLLDERSPRLRP